METSIISLFTSISWEDFKWAILSEIDEAEVLVTPNAIRNIIIIISIVLLMFVVVGAIVIINNIVVKD